MESTDFSRTEANIISFREVEEVMVVLATLLLLMEKGTDYTINFLETELQKRL